jgi:hypothetical protein
MKTIASIIVLVTLLLLMNISCKKDPIIIPPKDITGQWKWLSYYKVYLLSDSNPLTPANTGIQEILVFNANHTWFKTQNNIKTDSGTFSLGHGSYTPYSGAATAIYDSIVYYKNGIRKIGWQDYYSIFNDTLQICPGFADQYFSYSIPYSGSKFYRKQE